MAVFEQKTYNKVVLDDTVPLICTIEAAHNVKDHTEYSIKIQRGPLSDNNWTVVKRYSDFVALDAILQQANLEFTLPPKKVFGKLDREFIAERQQGLQNYLNAVLSCHIGSGTMVVKQFLDPSNYSENLRERALQHISMFFRSEARWEVIEPAPDIGWRYRKEFFFIKDKKVPKDKGLLSWCNFGPDKFLSDEELELLMRLFPSFQHPYLCPVLFATSSESSAITIRKFNERGTLRDLMCKTKPKIAHVKKYAKPKLAAACQIHEVKLIGRQILEALKYLHDKGLAHGHLHLGNVILEDGTVRLLDTENWLLGLPSYYREYFTQFKKIRTLESVDVYCFGHAMYEMTFAEQLDSPTCDRYPPDCPAEWRSVMECILTTEACKNGLPTLQDLLSHPFFSGVVLPPTEKPSLKIPSKLKEPIRQAKANVEKRLHEEQKVIHQFRKLSKAQAFHMSAEEKKKRRKSKKKQLESSANDKTSTSNDHTSSVQTTSSPAPAPTPPPPPPGPSIVPPPPPPLANGPASPTSDGSSKTPASGGTGRTALLSSINGFSKGGLKSVKTVDKSSPKF